MHPEAIEPYVDKVYAYAVKRTFTVEEAADLYLRPKEVPVKF